MQIIGPNEARRIPIFNWAEDIEDVAMRQAEHLAQLPFAFHHIALMPDCHSGYGMPIGGVLATDGVIIPNAVGFDIGCGMLSVKTTINADELTREHLAILFGGSAEYKGGLRAKIPVGFAHHSKKQGECWMPNIDMPLPTDDDYMTTLRICREQYDSARKQVGTLGGGNHFIEFQRGEYGQLWFTIHSGSRNLGHKVASYYGDVAKELAKKWYSPIPPEWDLAFLPMDSEEGRAYIGEMLYCVEFAKKNRALMAAIIKDELIDLFPTIDFSAEINIAHNYAAIEQHYGKNVWVHRKGATLARPNVLGVIPGSQGSKTYIVRGTGKHDSFHSCSHGAGRKLGRKAAVRSLNLEEERAKMDAAGVLMHGLRAQDNLDEAPGSYKDIARVMALQRDLVSVVEVLHPLASMKG